MLMPLAKVLSEFCRPDLIMTPGPQHELLEKLLFNRQVCPARVIMSCKAF